MTRILSRASPRSPDRGIARLPTSRLVRVTIPSDGGKPTVRPLDDATVTGGFSDLPTIAPAASGVPSYRFVYAIGVERPSVVSNRLVERTCTAQAAMLRSPSKVCCLRATFVPRPDGTEEDDGVVLSMEPMRRRQQLAPDARTMNLAARCRAPVVYPDSTENGVRRRHSHIPFRLAHCTEDECRWADVSTVAPCSWLGMPCARYGGGLGRVCGASDRMARGAHDRPSERPHDRPTRLLPSRIGWPRAALAVAVSRHKNNG